MSQERCGDRRRVIVNQLDNVDRRWGAASLDPESPLPQAHSRPAVGDHPGEQREQTWRNWQRPRGPGGKVDRDAEGRLLGAEHLFEPGLPALRPLQRTRPGALRPAGGCRGLSLSLDPREAVLSRFQLPLAFSDVHGGPPKGEWGGNCLWVGHGRGKPDAGPDVGQTAETVGFPGPRSFFSTTYLRGQQPQLPSRLPSGVDSDNRADGLAAAVTRSGELRKGPDSARRQPGTTREPPEPLRTRRRGDWAAYWRCPSGSVADAAGHRCTAFRGLGFVVDSAAISRAWTR